MSMIHPLADVQCLVVGKGTSVWQYAIILAEAVIGKNCNINCHTFIENDVVLGNNVTVKSGTYIWDGVRIEDDVFLGPNTTFTNDLRPRSKQRIAFVKTTVKKGASIGANTSILAGVTIGRYAMTGLASVVTKDVPDHALVYGNPAQIKGWVDENGSKLRKIDDTTWVSEDNEVYVQSKNTIKKVEL